MAKYIVGILVPFLFLGSAPALAAPIKFVCVMVGSTPNAALLTKVDRIIVDETVPFIDLQVSDTLDTQAPENWLHTNLKHPNPYYPVDSIVMSNSGGVIRAGGVRHGTAFTFIAKGRQASYVSQDEDGNLYSVKFRCSR